MINYEIWIAIISLAITLIAFFWKVAAAYGDLKYQIKENRKDINGLGKALREDINDQSWIIYSLINHIQDHLERTSDYHPPTLRREDRQ